MQVTLRTLLLTIMLSGSVVSSVWSLSAGQPSPTPAGLPSGVESVFVPKGTPVIVALSNALSSYAASSQEPIEYSVVQDVIVNGHVIAKSGDDATGIVLEAQRGEGAGFLGFGYKAADLRVNVQKVNNFCGDSIAMSFVRSEYRRRQGFAGSHTDLEIIKGQKFIASVAHPQKVCGEATSATPAPIPDDALGPDKR